MLFPNDQFHTKKSSHHTHNIALSGEGAENRCSLRIFVKDCRKQAIELIFSTKRDKTDHPILFFNNLRVTKVNKNKHLDLVLDSKLSFLSHINAAISKSRKALGLLKFLSKYLSRETLNALYKLYIRPHLDYSDVIYHMPNKEDSLHCHGNVLM